MKLIGNIVAAILFFFGVLFMWGAFTPTVDNQVGTLITGVILVMIGLPIAWYVNRKPLPDQKVTYEVELSGDMNLEDLKCKNCGGALSAKNIKMVAGAPWVEC